jgi:uncharacterized membrane protein (DUF485 family)
MDSVPRDIDRRAVIPPEWDCFAATQQFQKLLQTQKLFIVPAVLFSLAYCFALPVLVGLASQVMAVKTFGGTNLAYVLVLPQLFVAWLIGWPTTEFQLGTEALDVNR